MPKKLNACVSREDHLYQALQNDAFAAEYLAAAFEDGEPGVFLLALRHVVEARGGFSEISRKTGLERRQIYRTLSQNGNPRLSSLARILSAVGLHISFRPHASAG